MRIQSSASAVSKRNEYINRSLLSSFIWRESTVGLLGPKEGPLRGPEVCHSFGGLILGLCQWLCVCNEEEQALHKNLNAGGEGESIHLEL